MSVQITVRIPDDLVAGITADVRGRTTEIAVRAENGIDLASVINMDDIQTISVDDIIRFLGVFPADREHELTKRWSPPSTWTSGAPRWRASLRAPPGPGRRAWPVHVFLGGEDHPARAEGGNGHDGTGGVPVLDLEGSGGPQVPP